ncbi:MAG: c-type cytochrome [Nitrospirota bacterium]
MGEQSDRHEDRQPSGPVSKKDGEDRSNQTALVFLVVGVVLLTALWSFRELTTSAKKPQRPTEIPKTARGLPQLTQAMVPLVTGEEPLDQLFVKAGCPVCHTIPGIKGADGRVGPPLTLGTTGRQRLADPSYRGKAKTVRDYIVESVVEPSAYVVPGYPDRTMPAWYGQKLSATALDQVAAYLESLTEDAPQPGEGR